MKICLRKKISNNKKTDDESQKKLKDVQNKLADKMAEDMYRIVKDEVSKVDSEAGGFISGHLWKLKSKLRPKFNYYPTAMLDKHSNLPTTKEDIKMQQLIIIKKFL